MTWVTVDRKKRCRNDTYIHDWQNRANAERIERAGPSGRSKRVGEPFIHI